MKKPGNKRHNRVNDIVIAMVTDGSYTGGELSIIYKLVESLGCILETDVTLCIKYTIKKIFHL